VGATDGRFLNAHGTPTYGLSGMFRDEEGPRAHGLNERIRVVSLMNGRDRRHPQPVAAALLLFAASITSSATFRGTGS